MQGDQSEANIMAAELQAARQKIRELEEKLAKQKAVIAAQHEDHSFRKSVIERAAEGVCVCHDVLDFPYVEFTVWNQKMIEITDYTMEQINHNGWYQSMYPDPQVQAQARNRMDRMRQGDDLRSERWEITRADGEKRLIAISTSVLTTRDGLAHVLGMMHDFTKEEHLQIEAALARTDELTQINNRRGFKEEAELLFSLADRQKQQITCAFVDIDNFKAINDALGHAEGDEVLKVVAGELNDLTRSTDVVGRIGGDEFGFVLLGMEAAGAKLVTERLHKRLLRKMLDHGWKAGISMGVVSFSGSIPDIKHAIAYADRLMYQAKKEGKCKLIFEEVTGNSGSPIEHSELGITSNSSFG